jgi:PPOX class probable F420-dependent enzyme
VGGLLAPVLAHTMPMELDNALIFIGTHSRSVLATRRKNGLVQMSPVNAGVVDGAVCVSSRAPLAKVRNIRSDPVVSLLVLTEAFYGSWVQIDGRAEIVDQPEALDLLETVYRSIAGEHPDWDEYRQAMIRDQRVVIRILPEHASGAL